MIFFPNILPSFKSAVGSGQKAKWEREREGRDQKGSQAGIQSQVAQLCCMPEPYLRSGWLINKSLGVSKIWTIMLNHEE